MRRLNMTILALLVICFCLNSITSADESDVYYEFIKENYNLNEKKLNNFLLAELSMYLKLFPESHNLPASGFLMAKLNEEKGYEDIAFALLMKQLYLYPANPIQPQIVEEARSIITKHSQYKARLDELTLLLDTPFPACEGGDCYYNYLAFLYDLEIDKLYQWNINEYYDFIGKYGSDSRVEEVQRWIADTYLFNKDEEAAQAAYMKFERLYPESEYVPYARTQRARILYEDLKEYPKAIDLLTQVVTDYPTSDYAGSALYLRGEIRADKLREYNTAIADYRQLVNDKPRHEMVVDALFRIAEINQDKLDASLTAIGTYNEIVESYPDDMRGAKALEETAEIYLRLDNPLSAAQQYAKVATQFPSYMDAPETLIKAGKVCESKLKDYQKAIEYYQMVIDKYPDYGDIDKVEKRILKLREKTGE